MDLLTWATIASVVAIIAGALGFTGVARGAATIPKVLFNIFLLIAVLLFVLVLASVVLII